MAKPEETKEYECFLLFLLVPTRYRKGDRKHLPVWLGDLLSPRICTTANSCIIRLHQFQGYLIQFSLLLAYVVVKTSFAIHPFKHQKKNLYRYDGGVVRAFFFLVVPDRL